MNFSKKFTIKIPKNITILYCDEKKILTFLTKTKKKSLKLMVKIFFIKSLNLITVTDIPINSTSVVFAKKTKSLQGTTVAKIRQMLIEINYTLYNKLTFVGVGYRAFPVETIQNQLYFKLGYSHLIYFKVPSLLKVHCIKYTKLFIYGESSYEALKQISAHIRSYKKPEPYKGKGILYHNEKILLKKGKKI